MTPRARETSSPNEKQAAARQTRRRREPRQTSPRVQADRSRRRAAGSGTAAHPPLAGRAPQPRPGPGALPGSHHAARPRRRAAAAPGVLRARLAGDAPQVRDASRVPGDPLFDPERPRALLGGGGRRQAPGERHEEPGGAFRALREPGVLPQGQGAGRPLPPRAQADADGGSSGAGVRSPERAQALPATSRRVPPVVLDGASSGLWFDGWKGRGPPPGRYADADRPPEVAAPRTWLLSKGWRRIGLVDPAEVPGG